MLLSVKRLACHNRVTFDGSLCQIHDRKSNQVVAEGEERNNLYHLVSEPITEVSKLHESTHLATDINVLHRRLGHLNHDSIRQMVSKGYLKGIDGVTGKETFCESCVRVKMKKLLFKHEHESALAPLALIHSDVGGPITPQSPEGY
jgi:hypothetical protein